MNGWSLFLLFYDLNGPEWWSYIRRPWFVCMLAVRLIIPWNKTQFPVATWNIKSSKANPKGLGLLSVYLFSLTAHININNTSVASYLASSKTHMG